MTRANWEKKWQVGFPNQHHITEKKVLNSQPSAKGNNSLLLDQRNQAMSVSSYRKSKNPNRFAPVYSPISTYYYSSKSTNNDRDAYASFFDPRRTMSAGSWDRKNNNRERSPWSIPSSTGTYEDNQKQNNDSNNKSILDDLFNLFHPGKLLWGKQGRSVTTNSSHEVAPKNSNEPSLSRKHLRDTDDFFYLPLKNRKINPSNTKVTNNQGKKRALANINNENNGKRSIPDSKSRNITTTNANSQSTVPISFSKDPFGWNKWETEEIGTSSSTSTLSPSQYGTKLLRRHHRRDSPRGSSFSFNNTREDAIQVLREKSDEVSYLKQIFNGEYQIPKCVQDEREHQLKLLELDRIQDLNENKNIKRSIIDLTEKIKNVLLDRTHKKDNNENTDDIIIVKEKKISPLEKKRRQYLDEKINYNKSLIKFENEFKNFKDLLEERRKIQDEVQKKKAFAKVKNLIPTLSKEEVNKVQNTILRKDNAKLMNRDNLEINIRDFKTLAPRRWLNDTIIEFFMKAIEKKTDKVVAFNSFFYTTLSERGYQGVRRWMKRKKATIASLNKIFVPINLNQSHWALCIVDIKNKTIGYVDSLSNGSTATSFAILTDVQNYVIQESGNTLGQDFELIHISCPQQPNGFDCGIYVCMNTLYLSRDAMLTFDKNDAIRMRQYIGHLILSDSLK
ncbi:hypothetical protein NCAS_0J00620 [Naumovozyma castellii]|uniref:Ubiquitin-like protease family profile domain-containing protein n=1 Tax=Naumovozyma castellii TaxID=27288 RepID=G0VKK4_NAUCA|nr:hypothetical protein NCAS_0J00620 [Naumovozyma castellii CBS 4309]CCC72041.1 hypothetical protein NCAS_0J00620 [Naumovozyma castellii CBS 4309]